ncbi:MAG: hypothetical protein IKT23_03230 [Clostridia bacterium]|nr:hypothetical protein [Clostridia bacterium]
MKKIFALLSIACAVCACGDDAKVRSAITSRVKAELAACTWKALAPEK